MKALAILWLCLGCSSVLAGPQWVASATMPGPDQPPAGESRFDELFRGTDQRYHIPYPFTELVEFLESKIDNGRDAGVRQVFVPMGRSLQRAAAAPDFFRLPRAVIALQGEPVETEPVLEYRLFIAHQPATATLEIISYNDAVGRFEFQVVEDYAAERQPRVRQANRLMCLSCHQNAAPIFPQRPWSETTFNVDIATRLARALPQRFGSLIGTLTADAGAIDLLAERANYLAAAQLIWQQGCSAAACRAAALRALLQYRLSGSSSFARDDSRYRRDYYGDLKQNWQRKWPDGLALANSRIVDRNPLIDTTLTRTGDALSLRPPHATWHELDRIVADGIIFRLASFVTAADIRRIDDHLVSAADRLPAAERLRANCRLAHSAASTRLLECSGAKDGTPSLQAAIELEYDGDRISSLYLLSLRVTDDPDILQPAVGSLSRLQNGVQATLANADRDLSMRLADGNRLSSLKLLWQDDSLRTPSGLEIELVRDFQLLEQALAKLLQNHDEGRGNSLGSKPLQRATLMTELGEALGLTSPSVKLPQASSRQASLTAANLPAGRRPVAQPGDLALLQPFCGQCHGSETRNPPGFLAGEDARERVRQCAPRILARLVAWQLESDDAIVPMPPPATVGADWNLGESYQRMLDAVGALLPARVGAAQAMADTYDELPPCLAPS